MNTQLLGTAAARRADNPDRMRIIDEQNPAVFLRNLDQGGERRQIAFHTEYAVGCNEAKAIRSLPICFELPLQIVDIRVFVNFSVDDLSTA